VNTTLPLSAIRPPDTEDRQVLHIPAPDELRKLAFADRLSFRIGLWLLHRAQRPHRRRARVEIDPILLRDRAMSPRDALALQTFDLHRQMR
jgi:hypothetical protein